MSKRNIVGLRFGILTVLGEDKTFKHQKHQKWICRCDCGNVKSIYSHSLTQGRTKSCGCQMNKGKKGINKTHGMTNTRIYREWSSMRKRCKPNSPNSKHYFSRGITVCKEWEKDFMSFYKWSMDNGYSDELSIDRIDNDKGYSPENCRWITIEDQQSNKSNTIHVMYDGEEYCLRTLCTKIGFPYKTAHKRYRSMKLKGLEIDSEKLFAPLSR